MRVLRNQEFYARVRVEDEGGNLSDADSTPSVSVKNGAGTTVAGVGVPATDGTGIYKAQVPAQSTLDRLEATWSVVEGGLTRNVVNVYDVVGGRLVDLWRLREDAEMTSLSTPAIQRVSEAVEDWFARALGYPPVLEGARKSFTLPAASPRLYVPGVLFPQEVYALSIGDYDYTTNDLAGLEIVDGYIVNGSYGYFAPGRYTVHLAHGLKDAPEDLRRAGATLGRYVARASNLPERAKRILTQETEIWLSMPGADAPTGLPDVDAAIVGNRFTI